MRFIYENQYAGVTGQDCGTREGRSGGPDGGQLEGHREPFSGLHVGSGGHRKPSHARRLQVPEGPWRVPRLWVGGGARERGPGTGPGSGVCPWLGVERR